jgi:hypothetical protein
MNLVKGKKKSFVLGWFLLFTLLFGVLEVFSFITLNYLLPKGKTDFLLFTPPPTPTKQEYMSYLTRRDPDLGWPTTKAFAENSIDSSGSRPNVNFSIPGHECLSLYGDSFVYGSEVSHVEAWSNILSGLLGCRVGNFGVPGYGSDQALLRFKRNKKDVAPKTFFGIFPDNFKRNVNQYRYFIQKSNSNPFLFKPRFVIRPSGDLQLIRLPEIPLKNFDRFLMEPQQYLQYEYFIPESSDGPIPLRFPFLWRSWKLINKPEIKNWLLGMPEWHDFVQPEHASGALEVTIAITSQFIDECRKREKECLILIFPARNDFDYFRKTGNFALKKFMDKLDELNLQYLNLTPEISNELKEKSICEVLANQDQCSGHFGPEGNRLIAKILFQHLTQGLAMERSLDPFNHSIH